MQAQLDEKDEQLKVTSQLVRILFLQLATAELLAHRALVERLGSETAPKSIPIKTPESNQFFPVGLVLCRGQPNAPK